MLAKSRFGRITVAYLGVEPPDTNLNPTTFKILRVDSLDDLKGIVAGWPSSEWLIVFRPTSNAFDGTFVRASKRYDELARMIVETLEKAGKAVGAFNVHQDRPYYPVLPSSFGGGKAICEIFVDSRQSLECCVEVINSRFGRP